VPTPPGWRCAVFSRRYFSLTYRCVGVRASPVRRRLRRLLRVYVTRTRRNELLPAPIGLRVAPAPASPSPSPSPRWHPDYITHYPQDIALRTGGDVDQGTSSLQEPTLQEPTLAPCRTPVFDNGAAEGSASRLVRPRMAPEFPSVRASRLRVEVERTRWRRVVATRTHRDRKLGSALKSASHEGKGKGPAPAGGGLATVDPVREGPSDLRVQTRRIAVCLVTARRVLVWRTRVSASWRALGAAVSFVTALRALRGAASLVVPWREVRRQVARRRMLMSVARPARVREAAVWTVAPRWAVRQRVARRRMLVSATRSPRVRGAAA